MSMKLPFKSLVVGSVLAAVVLLAMGAAHERTVLKAVDPLRFRVLEITQHGEPVGGKQTIVVRFAPHHGKIDAKSLEFRRQHESPSVSFVAMVDAGYDLRTNDIIDLSISQQLKIGREMYAPR
jgi:hypothetical protein